MSNEKKNDGGQAFPYSGMERVKGPITGSESVLPVWHGGMSLRDYFAAKAMQGIVAKSGGSGPQHLPDIGNEAYMFADIMLKAREQ